METVKNITTAAPSDSANILVLRFNVTTANTYYIYARVNCPTWDDDSYWIGFDSQMNDFVNGLQTGGSWDWKLLYSGFMQTGSHQLNIAGREDGACIDKFCITADPEPPTGKGGTSTAIKAILNNSQSAGAVDTYSLSGIRLTTQNAGPYIEVRRSDDGAVVSRKVIRK